MRGVNNPGTNGGLYIYITVNFSLLQESLKGLTTRSFQHASMERHNEDGREYCCAYC